MHFNQNRETNFYPNTGKFYILESSFIILELNCKNCSVPVYKINESRLGIVLQMFQVINAIFVLLYFICRSLYNQLIQENSHEKFDERRIMLIKSQVIQLERQVCIHIFCMPLYVLSILQYFESLFIKFEEKKYLDNPRKFSNKLLC